MSESSNGKRKMSAVVDWSQMIGTIAGPMQAGDTRESWLARAARRAGISYRQAKALRYRETTDPKHSIASRVLTAAEQAKLDQVKRDVQQASEIYRTYAASLERIDADFHRVQIDAALYAASVLGSRDSS